LASVCEIVPLADAANWLASGLNIPSRNVLSVVARQRWTGSPCKTANRS